MKCSPVRSLMRLFLFFCLMPVCMGAPAQKVAPQVPTKPINLDRELEEQVKPDRAVSYYHFSLAKWNEDKGELPKAISEMRTALKYNPGSSPIYLEMATLLGKSGSIQEAIDHAQKAAELDPKNPGPHWLLANIYFRPQMRGDSATADIQKAVQELEIAEGIISGGRTRLLRSRRSLFRAESAGESHPGIRKISEPLNEHRQRLQGNRQILRRNRQFGKGCRISAPGAEKSAGVCRKP